MCVCVGFHAPRLVSIENCMKLTQMIVQGLQETKSPLLQLPHFDEEHLRYCVSKKVGRALALCIIVLLCVSGIHKEWDEIVIVSLLLAPYKFL